MIERALEVTIDYVKERKAFGKHIIDFQNTQFKLAECKTEATVAKVFCNYCIELHLDGKLDADHRLDGQAVGDRDAMQDRRRVPAVVRRLWLHERISHRAHVYGQPHPAHLWRHQRNHETADRANSLLRVPDLGGPARTAP